MEISANVRGWRKETNATEKDLVCIKDDKYSIEIKTSSSNTRIFGNRSYSKSSSQAKKDKSGYYLAVNFEKFSLKNHAPQITKIRFGWLDHDDWIGQTAPTGQQSTLDTRVERSKLLEIYPHDKVEI